MNLVNIKTLDSFTFVDAADTDAEVEADDSELADSDSGDPGRLIFFRLRGRPFNLGAVIQSNANEFIALGNITLFLSNFSGKNLGKIHQKFQNDFWKHHMPAVLTK